ncbi:MAG: response regulator [Crocinitomicaceae bacterium]|nr:response regulator [Crocinitomicaceae bacterium]
MTKKVLLVEDDLIHVVITKKYLELTNMVEEVFVAENGKIAFDVMLRWFENDEVFPDLILLDISMPVWDGWRFMEEVTKRNWKEQSRIYILTSSIRQEDQDRAAFYDLQDNYLLKPLKLEKIKEILM